jgi:hypothetical protein
VQVTRFVAGNSALRGGLEEGGDDREDEVRMLDLNYISSNEKRGLVVIGFILCSHFPVKLRGWKKGDW